MSKPKFRVILSILLCLAVLVAVFSVVQGAANNAAGARSSQPHVDAGLLPDFSRARTGIVKETQSFTPYYESSGKGGGCEYHYNDLDD